MNVSAIENRTFSFSVYFHRSPQPKVLASRSRTASIGEAVFADRQIAKPVANHKAVADLPADIFLFDFFLIRKSNLRLSLSLSLSLNETVNFLNALGGLVNFRVRFSIVLRSHFAGVLDKIEPFVYEELGEPFQS